MLNHRRRPWVLMPLLMALALSTSGCGLGLAMPTPTHEPAKLRLRFAFRENIADYTALADQFHQIHPDVALDLVTVDTEGGGLRAIDVQDVDVVRWSQDYLTPERVQQTLPVDEIILADDGFPRGDMLKGTMEALQRQGVQWGIPAGLDFVVAYYDAQRFKIAQATPPTPDWTLDDLLAAAIAVNNTEGSSSQAGFAYGFCSEPESADPVYFTYLFGGQLFDSLSDPSRPTLNDPANVKAVQWYADLRLKYGVIPDPDEIGKSFPHGRLYEAIVRSKCGLWFGAYADRGGQAWGYEWQGQGVMLPLPRARAPFGVIYVDGYYILTQSEHRREAWEWIRFLLDHQEAAGLMLPPLQSQARSAQYADRVGKEVAAVARQLPPNPIIWQGDPDPNLQLTAELYLGAVKKVIKEDIDAETALNEAQDQAEVLFSGRE